MLIRMRKLKLKLRPKIVTTNTKVDRREIGNEKKALKAAQLDRAIENELLERLKQVSDGEIYNYPEKQYSRALSRAEKKFAKEEVEEEGENEDEEDEDEEEDEEEEDNNIEYVEDFEESDEEGEEEDMEESADKLLDLYAKIKEAKIKRKQSSDAGKNNSGKRQKGPRVEVEYEDEEEDVRNVVSGAQYNF